VLPGYQETTGHIVPVAHKDLKHQCFLLISVTNSRNQSSSLTVYI
jgi:hypothetical protein